MMARAILSSALVALIKRKSYSTATTAATAAAATAGKGRRESKAPSSSSASNSASTSWAPDPVTGYYKPGNKRAEIDPVEMRARLLSQHKAQE